jgi:hypothetical protein
MSEIFEADVNYLAVILGVIAAQALGFLWYSTMFGERWMAARGYSAEQVQGDASPTVYVAPMVVAALIAYGLSRLVDMVGADDVGECIAVAAFVWICFAGAVQAGQINFSPGADKVKTFTIEGGYQLASFVIIGAIIGAFQ